MALKLLLVALPWALAQTSQFVPSPGNFPATGDDTIAGGIFCIPLSQLSIYTAQYPPSATGFESPKAAGSITSGSGPYPAQMGTDASLPTHTIYAPKTPPPGNLSLPFIAWANGACQTDGSAYRNFLTEIASWGYVIAADGAPSAAAGGQSKVQDSRNSVDWAMKGGAAKYGNIDTTKIATAGHSCGGLEAMSTGYHDTRVKLMMLFDIAIFTDDKRYLLQELKSPVAWFVGGSKDMGFLNSEKDYGLLPTGLPAYWASLDTGHLGTYAATNGGKFGKAAVSYLQWQFRGNATSKAICQDPKAPGSLVADNWNVTYKNWN
ncbi:hypothetical protein N431DRAFT_460164 [Stipitochalara longipes BDJ]|nr:hypothetical protein N431DRAFT_460164 [Stipitochalara longipes BDJ]